jgi:hypothetical protein
MRSPVTDSWGRFYDRGGDPLELFMWSNLFEDQTYKRINNTMITSADLTVAYNVSTIWLGIDHNFGSGPPIIFETMVFGEGSCDLACARYRTESEALRGHEEMVTVVASTVDDPLLMDAVHLMTVEDIT